MIGAQVWRTFLTASRDCSRYYFNNFRSKTNSLKARAEFIAGSNTMKIYYFDEGGRAEVSRLVLVWAGKDFDDIRMTFEEWPGIKTAMPLGQVPVLEMDGQKYPQSVAIAAYLAREFGLHGQTNLEGLKIDVIAQTVFEFRIKASKHYYEKDPEKRQILATDLSSKEAPFYLAYLEQQVIANGGKFTVGDSVTLADLIVYDLFKNELGKFILPNAENFPNLQKLVELIDSADVIKAYNNKKSQA